jgi:hypothetical protein
LGLAQGDATLADDSRVVGAAFTPSLIDRRTNQMAEVVEPAATWKRVIAAILDFFTIFVAAGYAIARVSGGMTDDGFKLTGAPALVLFAVIVVYFFVGRRYAGGTLWDRIFRIARPQPR